MRKIFLSTILFYATVGLSQNMNNSFPVFSKFLLSVSGGYTYTQEMFSQTYNGSNSFAFEFGGIANKKSEKFNPILFYFGYGKHNFKLNSFNNKMIPIYNIYISNVDMAFPIVIKKNFLLSFCIDRGWGIYKMSIDDPLFKSMGNSTWTELKDENNHWNHGYFFGPLIYISNLNHWALQYDYSFTTVEKSYLYLHNSVSIISYYVGSSLLDFFPISIRENSIFKFINYMYKIFFLIYWEKLDYEQHNWPFNDSKPLKYREQLLKISYYF